MHDEVDVGLDVRFDLDTRLAGVRIARGPWPQACGAAREIEKKWAETRLPLVTCQRLRGGCMSLFSRLFPKDSEDDPADDDDADGTVLVTAEDVADSSPLPSGYVSPGGDQTDPILLAPVLSDPGGLPPSPPPVPAVGRPGPPGREAERPAREPGRLGTGSLPAPLPRLPRPAMLPPPVIRPVVSAAPAADPPSPAPAPRRNSERKRSRTAEDAAADLAALHATFEDLAIDHVRPVRTLMLELRWGDAPASWIALARPALRSLRSMAAQVELPSLCTALDGFAEAMDEATRSGLPVLGGAVRQALLDAYATLAETLPRAFALEGEGNRREPVIVQGLLRQVPTLDPLMIERLCAAGLGRLDALLAAKADELMTVVGLPPATAAAVVAAAEQFRQSQPAVVAELAPQNAPREGASVLPPLVAALESQHRAYEQAAQGWTEESVADKRRLRRERTGTWLQITVILARLGALDWIERLEPLPFSRKLEELGRFMRQAKLQPGPPSAGPPASPAP
jgi:hypothetical protein